MAENLIARLTRERDEARDAIAETMDLIREFRAHLVSPKFHHDPTIQTRDVDMRLVTMLSTLLEGAG